MTKTLLAAAVASLLAAQVLRAESSAAATMPDEATTPVTPDAGGKDRKRHDSEPQKLDEVNVTALPIRQSGDAVIAPVGVLAGAALDDAKGATLGQTVAHEIGVQTSYFGPGVGRPVIRGLDGPRVGVLANGESSGDVSTVSQDHAVSIEPFLADQIEILKGPATLLYGSGAIGGVVNVVDGRIPEKLPEGTSGRAELRGNTFSDEATGMARVDTALGDFALHADGVRRDANDVQGPHGRIANSYVDTRTGAVSGSWIGADGFLGLAISRYLDEYGNPAEPGDAATGEPAVHLAMAQTRYDVKGGWNEPLPGFDSVRLSFGHTDYTHTEFEGDEPGTVFYSDSNEGRLELVQGELAGWRGAYGLQFLRRDFRAVGEESFVPQTLTHGIGLFGMEQRDWGRLKTEFGARIDRQSSDPADGSRRDFRPLSLSAGFAWKLDDAWHLSLNLDRAQRAPAEEELFANGPHAATNAFEIGLPDARKETANQAELGLHYHGDFVEAKVAAYLNRFNDYLYLADTGETEDDLPVRQWTQGDARFHGFEAEAKLHLGETASGHYDLRVWGDSVRARLDHGGNLPRIAPGRFGADLNWSLDAWRASIGVAHYFRQDRVAEHETPTAGYTLVDAHLSYTLDGGEATSWEFFLDGNNLTSATARLHTSFIKDAAPLPGRGVAFGVRAFF